MAGLTPIYGLRYAELVDPPDGAALGKNLADDVEAELDRIDTAAADTAARTTALEADAAAIPQRMYANILTINYNGAQSATTTATFPAEWASLGSFVAVTATHHDDPGFSRFTASVSNVSTAGCTITGKFLDGVTPAGYAANVDVVAVLL